MEKLYHASDLKPPLCWNLLKPFKHTHTQQAKPREVDYNLSDIRPLFDGQTNLFDV